MPFTEKVKFQIKKKTHQRCCICHDVGVEIHHLIPQSENGPDTFENGAPLCPSCHETYGENPKKRKFIREARDIWYEICAERYSPYSKRFDDIEKNINDIKKILSDKIEFITHQNEAHKLLSFGEVMDFYNSLEVEDNKGFKICYDLVFSTIGDSTNNDDQEFNAFRDTFLEIFGVLLAEKIIAYSYLSTNINWEIGVSEMLLGDFFNVCNVSMLLLFMHSDLPFEKEEQVGFSLNSDKTDLVYHKI